MSSDDTRPREAVRQGEPFRYVSTLIEEGSENEAGVPWHSESSSTAKAEKRERDAFAQGMQQGEVRANASFAARLTENQQAIQRAVEAFRAEREEYFNRVEPEVVQLSLAIARKILHREAQIDPLLLTGLVHVALEKLDAGTRVRLKVNPTETHFWNEFFARSSGAQPPELLGDAGLRPGECALETELGSTQISLDLQLKEIEQGFFDLLEQRPRAR